MYRELATIMDGEQVAGFLAYDGEKVSVMSLDEMKAQAMAGNVDSLAYREGHFIPVIQGKLSKELHILGRKHKKRLEKMDFDEFVAMDCVFDKKDVDILNANIVDDHAVLACISAAFEFRWGGQRDNWMLTTAFYTPCEADIARVRERLKAFKIKIAKDFGSFIMVNMPLVDIRTGFSLSRFQFLGDINVLYNTRSLDNMFDRANFICDCMPWPMNRVISMAKPTADGLNYLLGKLCEVNMVSLKHMAEAAGITGKDEV